MSHKVRRTGDMIVHLNEIHKPSRYENDVDER